MSQDRDTTIALFLDFDNVALGARDARQRFDVKLLMQRLLEKGKILVKKAYADWHYYKEHMQPLHESAIELIEIPMPRISGKNSADIKLVVDAMELCYTNDHIDTFVIVSGDSDFSPLVSKLRENNKRVVGVGVKNSSSHLLINNCDEFIFYDDIYRDAMGQGARRVGNVPADKREMFEFLVGTVQSLLQESRGVLYSSLIKDTMTRKMPDFNERGYGYSTFGDMLDDARRLGLLVVERDAQAGGTWVVQGLGDGKPLEESENPGGRSSSRRRRRSSSRKRGADGDDADRGGRNEESRTEETIAKPAADGGAEKTDKPQHGDGEQTPRSEDGQAEAKPAAGTGDSEPKASRKLAAEKETLEKAEPEAGAEKARAEEPGAVAEEKPDQKTARKVSPRKKATKKTTKKTVAKKAPAKKTGKKAPAKKTTKKTAAKKAPAKKTAKKVPAKKTTRKGPNGKTTKKAAASKANPRQNPGKKAPARKKTSGKGGSGNED